MTTNTTYEIIEDSIKSLRASKARLEKWEKKALTKREKAGKAFEEALLQLAEVEQELVTTNDALALLEG